MHQVCQMQTLQTWCTLDSACHWPLGVVCGPAHGPRADVVELAAGARPPVIVAFPQRKELPLAASQRSRNGAVVPRWDERQPSQDGGDWHNVDDLILRLIQLLRPAFTSSLPPGGYSLVYWKSEHRSIWILNTHIVQTQRINHKVCKKCGA